MFVLERPKAKKAHVCDHCHQRIPAGETYVKEIGTNDDGEFGVFKSHADCKAAERAYRRHSGLEEVGICLRQDLSEEDEPWMRAEFPIVANRIWGAIKQQGDAHE